MRSLIIVGPAKIGKSTLITKILHKYPNRFDFAIFTTSKYYSVFTTELLNSNAKMVVEAQSLVELPLQLINNSDIIKLDKLNYRDSLESLLPSSF